MVVNSGRDTTQDEGYAYELGIYAMRASIESKDGHRQNKW